MTELVHHGPGGGAVDGDPRTGAGGQPVLHVDILLDVEDDGEAEHGAREGGGPGAGGGAGDV